MTKFFEQVVYQNGTRGFRLRRTSSISFTLFHFSPCPAGLFSWFFKESFARCCAAEATPFLVT
jgi:hypothetical protein